MTVQTAPTTGVVDVVKNDLKSPDTTTTQTLNVLRAILGLDLDLVGGKATPIQHDAASKRTPARSIKIRGAPKRPQSKKTATFDIHEPSKPALAVLEPKARKQLATTAFNTTLKTLNLHVKSLQKIDGDIARRSPKAVPASKPLEECSPNPQRTPARVKTRTKPPDSTVNTVECAFIALESLRKLQDANTAQKVRTDLESGALILLDKTISLGLQTQSNVQLRRIHDQYWKRRRELPCATHADTSPCTISCWLLVGEESEKVEFKMATSLQSQCLRFALLQGSSIINDDFIAALRPETQRSPCSVLLRGRELGLLPAKTCHDQLQTISMALSKLCAICAGEKVGTLLAPKSALNLACIALQTKVLSWSILKCEPDLAKELWSPLTRLAKRHVTQSSKDPEAGLALSQWISMFHRYLEQFDLDTKVPCELQKLLRSGESVPTLKSRHDDSQHVENDTSKQHLGQALVLVIKKVCTSLDAQTLNVDTAGSSLQHAIEYLDDPSMHQDVPPSLLSTQLAQARRSTVAVITHLQSQQNLDTGRLQLLSEGIKFVYALLNFWSRYARLFYVRRDSHASDVSGKGAAAIALGSAKSIEAALSLSVLPVCGNNLAEERSDALSSCLQLVDALSPLDNQTGVSESLKSFLQQVHVRVSQQYWTQFRSSTEEARPLVHCITLLKQSIHTVTHRPLRDRKAASMSLKYDKLASLLQQANYKSEALMTARLAVQTHIDFGILDEAVETSLSTPCDRFWDGHGKIAPLGESISFYARCVTLDTTSSSERLTFYDDPDLAPFHRCVLLERQITSCLAWTSTHRLKELLKDSICTVLRLAKEISYHAWGLRFVSRVLWLMERGKVIDPSFVLDANAMEELLATPDVVTNSVSLDECRPLLKLTVTTQWRFSVGSMDKATMTNIVDSFRREISEFQQSVLLKQRLCDVQICLSQVKTLADYAGFLDLPRYQLVALVCARVLQDLSTPVDPTERLKTMLHVANLQSRLGETTPAEISFKRVEKIMKDIEPGSQIRIEWSLSYAAYLVDIQNLGQARNALEAAGRGFLLAEQHKQSLSSRARIELETMLCKAAVITSRLVHGEGQTATAAVYARKAVKLSTALWSTVERALKDESSASQLTDGASVQSITAGVSNLELSEHGQEKRASKGCAYWSHAQLHRQCLNHMGTLSMHSGLYQDALFYYQQITKVSPSTHHSPSIAAADVTLLYAMAGDDRAVQRIDEAHKIGLPNRTTELEECDTVLKVAEAAIICSQWNTVQRCLETIAGSTLQCFREAHANKQDQNQSTSYAPPKPGQLTRAVSTTRAKAPRVDAPPKQSQVAQAQSTSVKLQNLQERLMILENDFTIRQHSQGPSIDKSLALISGQTSLEVTVSFARAMLHRAIRMLVDDPLTNALAETALAVPVKHRPIRKSGQMSLLMEGSTLSPVASRSTKASDLVLADTQTSVQAHRLLLQAGNALNAVGRNIVFQLSSAKCYLLHRTLSQISLLSSALSQPLTASPFQIVLQNLLPKDVARAREADAILAEDATASKEQVQSWPSTNITEADSIDRPGQQDFHYLAQDLPASWSLISVGLSEDHQELLLSKTVAGSTPFLMRLPLSRPSLEGDDVEQFTLAEAKAELVEIVTKANASCHDARGSGDKATRKAWYTERESLDQRLEVLLGNMESIWLGGFRGLLSSVSVDENLLSRFGHSLAQALDNHLPSRQKSAKTKNSKVDLHAHVLELFTTLQFAETPEFEDSITDLLYFVVDILQFNGEHNAYDEIDFDGLLVNILDALRGYHSATAADITQQGHIILILDKELGSFPWESMPCLRGRSISRMPSLGAVKERLDMIRAQSPTADHYTVPASQGAYMLNPSSDLTFTQETFSAIFQSQLASFNAITDRIPTESEFESCLTSNSLFLYFGHGSGAQYIRGRSIRRLKKCAVTWLMGCSSAKMTECGQLESYGMPNYYMHAGSVAMVGTLWDVTDREIDRFALRGLCEWGLVGEVEGMGKVWKKRKGAKGQEKGRVVKVEERRGKVSLDQAVSTARDECMLRYLSAGSVVVWGVPVVLE